MILVLALTFWAANLAANLIIADQGPSAAPYVALGLVALTLVTRDLIHDRLEPGRRLAFFAALIVAGAVGSYLVNRDAQTIAIASAGAFAIGLAVDTLVYHASRYHPWLDRTNRSNVAGSLADTAAFFLLAGFGLGGPAIVQAGMKIAGGAILALLLARYAGFTRPTYGELVRGIELGDRPRTIGGQRGGYITDDLGRAL